MAVIVRGPSIESFRRVANNSKKLLLITLVAGSLQQFPVCVKRTNNQQNPVAAARNQREVRQRQNQGRIKLRLACQDIDKPG
jgi:hypothetical protein